MTITPPHAQALVEEIASADRAVQQGAYESLLQATTSSVSWAYDIWNDIVEGLAARDNRQRSICAQVLANLAAHSDPDARILHDLDALAAVMADDRFVTARHALQSSWKVGLGGDGQRAAVAEVLSQRFQRCVEEKNTTLVRTDIIVALAQLDLERPGTGIEAIATGLIAQEVDDTQRRKQTAAWHRTRSRAT